MGTYLSPGVYTREKDISDIITGISTSTAGIVGYSTKGDTTQLRLITNTQQFIEEYGEPVPGNYFHYSALAYLKAGNKLQCLRIVNGALYGGAKIMVSTGVTANVGFTTGTSTPDFSYTSGTDDLFWVFGKDPGTWNGNVGVRITNVSAATYEFNIDVYYTDSDGVTTEMESWTVSRRNQTDGYGKQQYLEDKINGYSDYIVVADNVLTANTAVPKAQATTLTFVGGSDGSAVSDSHYVTGWEFFSNPDEVDVRILIEGGSDSVVVQQEMLDIAEDRKDCVALLDMPYAQIGDVNSMVSWRDVTQNFNSSYCALYAPWVKYYDSYSDKILEIPPSGFVAAQMAYNDYIAQVWYPAAGLNRGLVSGLGVTKVFTQGERDILYAAGINPIQTFTGEGTAIWGQKTEQSKASALDRLNVRRSLIIIEKSIAVALHSFVFELNNETTRFRVTAMCETYLDMLSAQGAFQTEADDKGYAIVCDETNNTPAIIDRNEMHVDIFVKPVRAAEYIQLQTIITNTGASFNELIAKGINLS